jgi:hypothetical protein
MFGKLLGALLGGSVEVSTMNILYQFIESETHFGMPRGAKISFRSRLCFIQIQTLPLSMHKWKEINENVYKTINGKS